MQSEQIQKQKHEQDSSSGKHLVVLQGSTFQFSGPNYFLLNNAIWWKKLGYKVTIICQDRDAKTMPAVDDYIQGQFSPETPKLKAGQLRVVVPDINNLIPILAHHKSCSFEGVTCKTIQEMTDEQIQTNISMTIKSLRDVCLHDRPFKVISNFMILSGVICSRGLHDLKIPYDITVPGPALRYTVMPYQHLWKWIEPSFQHVSVFYHRTEFVKQLFLRVFKKQIAKYNLKQKSLTIGPGLDVQHFKIPESYENSEKQFFQIIKKIAQTHQKDQITQKLRTYGLMHQTENNQLFSFQKIIKLNLVQNWLPYNEADETILYVGAFMDKMGAAQLILFCTKLIAERPSVKLIVCGIGPLKQPLMQFLHALHQEDLEKAKFILDKMELADQVNPADYLKKISKTVLQRIIFTGLLDAHAIAKLMPLCTLYIAPGKLPQECNLTVIEALCFGLTPICNERSYFLQFMNVIEKQYPELAEVARIQHDQFFAKLPETIIKTLDFLKNNKLGKKEYREKLRQIVVRNFSWEHTARALASQNKQLIE